VTKERQHLATNTGKYEHLPGLLRGWDSREVQNPDGTMRVQSRMRVAVGKEVQNSRTKSAFQAPQWSSCNALLSRFGQLSVDRGRGPQWAAGSPFRCGSNCRDPAACSDSGLGQVDGVTASLLGKLTPPPAANWAVEPGSAACQSPWGAP